MQWEEPFYHHLEANTAEERGRNLAQKHTTRVGSVINCGEKNERTKKKKSVTIICRIKLVSKNIQIKKTTSLINFSFFLMVAKIHIEERVF